MNCRSLAWSLLLACAACKPAPPVKSAYQSPETDGAAPAAEEPEPEAKAESKQATRMQEHFARISTMKDAVVSGDLDVFRSLAAELAESPLAPDAPREWAPHLDAVRRAASGAKNAADVKTAAAAVANLATTCGACHQSLNLSLELPHPPLPGTVADVQQAMAAHQWASDRMWEGVILPSDEVWRRGMSTFVALPGCGEVPTNRPPSESSAACRKIQQVVRGGERSDDPAARARTYGDLLATCAACHAQNRP
jgi:hypothetical protein